MFRVESPSRLHFGLFNFAGEDTWANVDGANVVPARRYGGVGLMIDVPGIAVVAEPARGWSALGPSAVRALDFAQRFVDTLPNGMPPQRLTIESAPPEHVGLGAGTQVALAVAKALALSVGHADWDAVELARRVGRGRRSAVGIHGFRGGGFIVEGGKRGENDIAPLLARVEFPPEWPLIVAIPTGEMGLHGDAERQALARLREAGPHGALESLCRLVLLGLLPALAERDYSAFAEALYDFNARSGEAFAPMQGGRYAHAFASETIGFLRSQGVVAAGQSSWGPAVFAVLDDDGRGRHVREQLRQRFADDSAQIFVTAANNTGAQ
jgi:beta-ribofuranosylaminobenzene 5'-phosphate synthase